MLTAIFFLIPFLYPIGKQLWERLKGTVSYIIPTAWQKQRMLGKRLVEGGSEGRRDN